MANQRKITFAKGILKALDSYGYAFGNYVNEEIKESDNFNSINFYVLWPKHLIGYQTHIDTICAILQKAYIVERGVVHFNNDYRQTYLLIKSIIDEETIGLNVVESNHSNLDDPISLKWKENNDELSHYYLCKINGTYTKLPHAKSLFTDEQLIDMIKKKVESVKTIHEGVSYWRNQRNEYHRLDGPAIEYPDGTNLWYKNGLQHRDGNLPSSHYPNGDLFYYVEGVRHRTDGPAVEFKKSGSNEYWLNGKQVFKEDVMKLNNVKKENNQMNEDKTVQTTQAVSPGFFEMTQNDMKSAGLRIATTQLTKGAKAGVLHVMQTKGADNARIQAVADLLNTEAGDVVVCYLLGMLTTYLPQLKDNPHAAKLAEEFRINAMAMGGNAVFSEVMSYMQPLVMDVIGKIPSLIGEEATKVRVPVNNRVAVANDQEVEINVEEDFPVMSATAAAVVNR